MVTEESVIPKTLLCQKKRGEQNPPNCALTSEMALELVFFFLPLLIFLTARSINHRKEYQYLPPFMDGPISPSSSAEFSFTFFRVCY